MEGSPSTRRKKEVEERVIGRKADSTMEGLSDSKIAYVEDCSPDGVETMEGSRRTAHAKARRQSYKASLGRAILKGDEVSDSGYSSHTGATVASEDSIPTPRQLPSRHISTKSTPKAQVTVDPAKKKRPSLFPSKTVSNDHVSNTVPRKSATSPQKTRTSAHGACDCDDCLLGKRRVPLSPLEQPWDLEFPPESSSRYSKPPSPLSSRRYPQPSAVLHDYGSRPRASTAADRQARPVSMYGSSTPYYEPDYVRPSYDVPYEREFPLRGPSYLHSAPRASYMPAASAYPSSMAYADYADRATYPMSQSLPRRLPDYPTPRPLSTYDYPSYGEYDELATPPWTRDVRPSYIEPLACRRYDARLEEDYLRMPPPPAPRPIPKPSYSSSAAYDLGRRSSVRASDTGATVSGDRFGGSSTPHPPSAARRPSMSSDNSSSHRKSRSYYDGAKATQVEHKADRRRASFYGGHEKLQDQERRAEAYQAASGTVPAAEKYYPPPSSRHRVPHSGSGSGSRSRVSSSREESDSRARTRAGAGSRTSTSNGAGVNVQIGRRGEVHMNYEGRSVSVNSGQDGGPYEVTIAGQRSYGEAPPTAGGRSGRDARQSTTTRSRHSSKAPLERDPLWI